MKLREIVALTTTQFAEREVGKIEPDWMRGLLGTHTLNSDGEVTVIDGVRYRWGRR